VGGSDNRLGQKRGKGHHQASHEFDPRLMVRARKGIYLGKRQKAWKRSEGRIAGLEAELATHRDSGSHHGDGETI
jgi:hypothetical protein